MAEYPLIAVIIFFAAFAHGVAGFGQGLIAMPLFAVFIDIKAVIPLSMLNGLSIGSALAFRWRRRLNFTKAAPLVLSSLIGTPIGVYFLKTWDETALRMGLGILLTAFSVYSLSGVRFRGAIDGVWGYAFGFFSGMVGGAFGLNAPVSLIYITSTGWDVEEKKAVMVTNFVISNAVILCLYFVAGVPMLAPVKYAAICAPSAIVGAMIGASFSDRLKKETVEQVIYVLVLVMGISLII